MELVIIALALLLLIALVAIAVILGVAFYRRNRQTLAVPTNMGVPETGEAILESSRPILCPETQAPEEAAPSIIEEGNAPVDPTPHAEKLLGLPTDQFSRESALNQPESTYTPSATWLETETSPQPATTLLLPAFASTSDRATTPQADSPEAVAKGLPPVEGETLSLEGVLSPTPSEEEETNTSKDVAVMAENLIRLHNRCQNLSSRSMALGSFQG